MTELKGRGRRTQPETFRHEDGRECLPVEQAWHVWLSEIRGDGALVCNRNHGEREGGCTEEDF